MPAASWLSAQTDDALRRRVGSTTFLRALTYARQGRIKAVVADATMSRIVGSVRGSGGRVYQVIVSGDDAGSWHATCSCPIGLDCKHAIAVVLTQRSRAATQSPAWEDLLGGIL